VQVRWDRRGERRGEGQELRVQTLIDDEEMRGQSLSAAQHHQFLMCPPKCLLNLLNEKGTLMYS
jgi:hypothetical protein